MKDCYFFWSGDGEFIYVDHKRGEPIALETARCYFTHEGNGDIHCIQDATTGKRYYPADDCKVIQQ